MLAFVTRQNKPGTIRSLAKSIRREQWSTMRDDRRCAFANCLLCIYLNYNGRSVYRLAPLTTYEDHLNASLSGQKTGVPSGNSIDTCNLSRIISSVYFINVISNSFHLHALYERSRYDRTSGIFCLFAIFTYRETPYKYGNLISRLLEARSS